jgi:hypothetical protein
MTDHKRKKLCDVYTRERRGGGQYQVSCLGSVTLLIFPAHNPHADGPTHGAFIAPRPARQAQRSESLRPAGAGSGWLAGTGRESNR